MSDAIQNAANAFAADMGIAPTRSSGGAKETSGRPEVIMQEPGFLENPEERAGGDHLPNPTKSKKVPYTPEPDEPVDLDEVFGDPEDEDDENEDEREEGDEDEESDKPKKKGEEDDEDDDELLSQEVTIMVDGEETTVTLKEAIQGYQRRETFHRRMNAVNEAEQELLRQANNVVQSRGKVNELLAEAQAILDAVLPQEPNWDDLFAKDPANARALQKQFDGVKAKIDAARSKAKTVDTEQQAVDTAELKKFVDKEFKIFASTAKWKDRGEMEKDLSSMRRTALAVGFTEQEAASVYDSRMLNILRKASKYDRMMANRPKLEKSSKTPVTPGAGRANRTAPKGLSSAQKQLSRTGSVEDAGRVFEQLLFRRR